MIIKRSNDFILLISGLVFLLASTVNAQVSFTDYKTIWNRNIFDSERRPYREEVRPVREPERREPPENFRLSGVLINDDRVFVFFNGSRSEYNCVLQTGDQIAGYSITDVRTDQIRLQIKGKEVVLPVGKTMTRNPGSDWVISESFIASAPAVNMSSGGNGEKESVKESGNDTNDLLKKMMERRRQEIGQ